MTQTVNPAASRTRPATSPASTGPVFRPDDALVRDASGTVRYHGSITMFERLPVPFGVLPSYEGFSQTEMCCRLSLVKGSRFQPFQRSRRVMPASCAIRSSSVGQT
jgi:hypothetical protein